MKPEIVLVVGGRRFGGIAVGGRRFGELFVGAREFSGWKSARVTRSIESIAGSFALDVTDSVGGEAPWPIETEDHCRVEIGDQVVIDGYIDKRSIAVSAEGRTLAYEGRDRAAALVDCSAILDAWSFTGVDVLEFARKIAAPFGVTVRVASGLKLAEQPKLVITPGDSAFDALTRAVGDQGVLLVSDGSGGILITRGGTARATSLVEGENIKTVSVDYDGAARFHHYVVAGYLAGTNGVEEEVLTGGHAVDEGVRRVTRSLVVRPEKSGSMADTRRRADWEARVRAARAETVAISVVGWLQPNGKLWPVNERTRVKAPSVGVDADMLISEVEYSISNEGGQVTQLRCVRPDAFTPEPKAGVTPVVKPGTRPPGWPELKTGGSQNLSDLLGRAAAGVADRHYARLGVAADVKRDVGPAIQQLNASIAKLVKGS